MFPRLGGIYCLDDIGGEGSFSGLHFTSCHEQGVSVRKGGVVGVKVGMSHAVKPISTQY